MERILEHFRVITAIPRCSFNAEAMRLHIKTFAHAVGCDVVEDEFGNVLCRKGNPRVCLQAHYDMVCIGDVQSIEIKQENGCLKAKNSTLGADNGIGMAMMFCAMEEHEDIECLFTADEEVGLIGAMQFRVPLQSSYLINLDAEEEGEIYIGCAGGVDVVASMLLELTPLDSAYNVYAIEAKDFLGGHSGVDIDKNIPSAIKALAYELSLHKACVLVSFEGGERRNAIPRNAKAIIAIPHEMTLCDERLSFHKLENTHSYQGLVQSSAVIKALAGFAQGVRAWDKTLGIPSVSINIGVISQNNAILRIDCAARAMDDTALTVLAHETEMYFQGLGFSTVQEGFHSAWKPEMGALAHLVKESMKDIYPQAIVKAIHAGLECGELISHQPKKIEAVSIGPTIRYPHSLREECELDSIERMSKIVKKLITTL